MMSFEARCADMAVHGWRPVRTTGCVGIHSDELNYGVGICVSPQMGLTVGNFYTLSIKANLFVSIDWEELGEANLALIEKRLS